MFSNLQENLDEVIKKLKGKGKITEKNTLDAMREIRMALLEADVDYDVAKKLIEDVKNRALGEKVIKSIQPGQQIVKIFQEELIALFGTESYSIDLNKPSRILIVGLNGAGKTTTTAKLALNLKKQGRTPFLVSCDTYRPAAIEQLKTLSEQVETPFYEDALSEKSPIKVIKKSQKWLKKQNAKISIFDTAGRQEIDEDLLKELKEIKKLVDPTEIFLVADSATGQQAVQVAKKFDETVGLTGIILTKLDGDARGGAALSMYSVTNKPIRFLGVGEQITQFEKFDAERVVDRILGMGDIVSLVETASEAIEEEEAMKMAKRMQSAKFDLNDFLSQLKMMKKMGPLQGVLEMMPGASKMKNLNVAESEKKLTHTEAIILSMTKDERARPIIIKSNRKKRIANGSGTSVASINQLLKQFSQMKKMFSGGGGKLKQMMSAMGGGGGLGGLMGKLGGGAGDMEGMMKELSANKTRNTSMIRKNLIRGPKKKKKSTRRR